MTSITANLPTNLTLTQPADAKGDDTLNQAAFLRLMTTQLKTQDPFKPLDNNAMVAQMAQFSSVAGIEEMNASLALISSKLGDNNVGDASSWLGRNILVAGNIATPDKSGQYAGEFNLDAKASNLSVDLLNGRGEIVQAIELGEQEAGPIVFSWDAIDNNSGRPLPHGPLRVRVNGGAASGLSTWTKVDAVENPADSANAKLMTQRGEFSLLDAIRLS